MEFLIISFLTAFSVFGYIHSKSIISPWVISPMSWLCILGVYLSFDHGMYKLNPQVLIIILVWNFFILFGVFVSENFVNIRFRIERNEEQFSLRIRNLYYKISLFGFLPTLYVLYRQLSVIPGDFFYKLRMANTGLLETKVSLGVFAYTLTIAFISYMMELIELNKEEKSNNKKRFYIILIINVVFALSTMSKSSFMFLIFPSLIVIFFKTKVSIVKLAKYSILIFFLMFSVQSLRDGKANSNDTSSIFYTYLLGGLPALDKIVERDMHSFSFGQNVLVFFNNFSEKLGLIEKQKKIYINDFTDEGYIKTPSYTNVYTVIGPIWLDFRYYGIVICGFVVGFLSGFFYRLSCLNFKFAYILYSYMGCVLLLQFFGEYIFTNMSYLIQLILLSYIPYKFRNVNVKWKK